MLSLFRRRKPQPSLLDEKTSAEMTRLEAHVAEFACNEEKLFEAIEHRRQQREAAAADKTPARGVVVIALSDSAA